MSTIRSGNQADSGGTLSRAGTIRSHRRADGQQRATRQHIAADGRRLGRDRSEAASVFLQDVVKWSASRWRFAVEPSIRMLR